MQGGGARGAACLGVYVLPLHSAAQWAVDAGMVLLQSPVGFSGQFFEQSACWRCGRNDINQGGVVHGLKKRVRRA
ncbi:hypothetical protein ATO7_04635 [Oceanococcus atlanticus]|uniref:Uncharacterized protein n=1 Tax=Oceanococcus atlanticus TaxID=1317117 RepID=A0A1Y1SHK6_9GAMM|nr:hypothetical protein ATO7_04635 [Oceanococcus atlanticus]